MSISLNELHWFETFPYHFLLKKRKYFKNHVFYFLKVENELF